jgi:hypothetical protein
MNQIDFLQTSMADLHMTRDQFAQRLGCARRTLDKWLLPENSTDHRKMPETVRNLVDEILAHEDLKEKFLISKGTIPMNDIVAWPAHIEAIHGKLEVAYDTVRTSSLSGFRLDYVLAAACQVPQIKLQYFPGLRSAQISVLDSTRGKEFIAWSPTTDAAQAEQVLKKIGKYSDASSFGDLLSAAMISYPDTVNIPVPRPLTSSKVPR